jgi:hypothetical protein
MPSTFTLHTAEFTDFKRDLERHLATGSLDALRAGGDRVGIKLDQLVREELPPATQSKAPPSPLVTDKQKRYWWAAMRAKADGKTDSKTAKAFPGWKAAWKKVDGHKVLVLSGGYKRTGKLPQSLTWEVIATSDHMQVRYGSNRVYAPYVLGDPDETDKNLRQARIHQGNWTPLVEIARDNIDVLTQAFIDGAMPVILRDLGAS